MATYAFKCGHCNHESEVVLTMAEKKEKGCSMPCPECKAEALQVFTTAHALYKAGGFYGSVPTTEAHAVNLV